MIEVLAGVHSSWRRFIPLACHHADGALVSANSLFREGRFRLPPADVFDGHRIVLDSGGYVAMTHYGFWRFGCEAYADLAASRPWAWWASMDWFVDDPGHVVERRAATVRAHTYLRWLAVERSIPDPVPVLQGVAPDDYLRCADALDVLPDFVGIGSVVRRPLDDLVALIDRLDARLPPRVTMHLFGLKGPRLAQLRGHPRIRSVDSMSWDFEARRRKAPGTSCDNAVKEAALAGWAARQKAGIARPGWEMQMDLLRSL
jgi:hypothetical protein